MKGLNKLFKTVLVETAWPKAASRQGMHSHLHVVAFQAMSFFLHSSASHGSVNFQGTAEKEKKAAGQERKQHPPAGSGCFSIVFL